MRTVLVIFALAMLVPSVFAESTGSIYGIVTDKETGKPIGYANVVVVGTKMGGMTLADGTYRIIGVPAGAHAVKAMMMGYATVAKTGVDVKKGMATEVNFVLEREIVGQTQEIIVEAEQPQISVSESALKSGIVKAGDELYVGGGRSNEFKACRIRVPCNFPGFDFNTEEYEKIYENRFLESISNPLSTFSIDVDVASYGNARRFIMHDRLPPKDAVRIEEFINYFNYDYTKPEGEEPFSINLEFAACPWNEEHQLVHIGLQGEELGEDERKPSNLVFLIDVSGSMRPENKLPLLRKAFRMLVDQLQADDRVSIVVYAGAAGLVLPSTKGSEKERIKDAIGRLEAGGSTAGHAGIMLAYKVAKEHYIRGGNNRVILATDGDFNIGVSSTSELIDLIEEKREDGIFLTILGFGMGNYKDHRLEQLADKGNGNHAYIDNLLEAKKVLVDDVTATLYTIAKDVKIQVEFNPARVASYRLVGYENRLLAKEDFDDDTKDAGEIGAGHTVTALYEIVPVAEGEEPAGLYELKYQETKVKDDVAMTDEILTVNIRYKEPEGDTSRLISAVLAGEPEEQGKTSDDFRFSAAVAMFAMILRDSEYMGDSSFDGVADLAKTAMGDDRYTYRAGFLQLVERAKLISDLASR